MSNTYTWTITALVGYPAFEGETDVVTQAFYTVTGDDGEGHSASFTSFQPTPLDPSVPFIPYADLTPEIVIGWVQAGLGPEKIASIEESISIRIQQQITPPPSPQEFPLPWPTTSDDADLVTPQVSPAAEPVSASEIPAN